MERLAPSIQAAGATRLTEGQTNGCSSPATAGPAFDLLSRARPAFIFLSALFLIFGPSAVATVYTQSFDTDNGGFTVSGTTSWAWGQITSGPGNAYSGSKAWATNPAGDYANGELNGNLSSPEIDLSTNGGQTLLLSWWQFLVTEKGVDEATVAVSKDGGANWETVREAQSGSVSPGWEQQNVFLDATYATSSFRMRFGFNSDESLTAAGFYVDDISIDTWEVTSIYSETFDADNGGYSVSGTSGWEWGTPTSDPDTAHSGTSAWATGLGQFYENNTDSYLVSPAIDVTPAPGEPETILLLSWWQVLHTEGVTQFGNRTDFATVDVSRDGTTWKTVYGKVEGEINTSWARRSVLLNPPFSGSGLQVRFRLYSDGSLGAPGFCVDDVELFRTTVQAPDAPVVTLFSGRDATETVPGYTDGRTLTVALSGSVEGSTITGWQVTETDTPPLAGDSNWLAAPPETYSITGPAGEIALYGWLRSSAGTVSAATSTSQTVVRYEPSVDFTFRLTEGGEERSALRFGTWGQATEAFDLHLDAQADDGDNVTTTAYFLSSLDDGPEKLQADYRPPASILRWRLVVEATATRAPVTLEWNVSSADAERLFLLQALRDETPNGAPVDMTSEGEMEISATTVFEVAYGMPEEARLELGVGWNLVGTPVMTDQPLNVFFSATSLGVWSWHDGAYSELSSESPMNAEQGYFLHSEVAGQSQPMRGLVADGNLTLNQGWNLVSPVRDGVIVNDIEEVGRAWWWDPLPQSYVPTEAGASRQGRAYWIFIHGE
ncbi:MAG: hypothetical protein HN742_20775 [Lentisphaerae bacterium]|jgi:hypothetical protein|nr:hypothetical protein [Lentisphaerota bacterium]MBT4818334.1 hypothetical protein [Lentisphaerota bacterium]MBT5610697.1 hypothetical protein [Lentisphaerota bacterium]MBT7054266.1 hypothetical protein [Lentisphaerota bacterium]MBT7844327.1 hypothetical protein [Lentisphaerota bacterium]